MNERTRPMAIVTAPGRVELHEKPIPSLGPQDVHVQVKAATICGSDLHIYKGKHPAAALPVPVGHEIAGQVAAVGPEVRRIQPGDRVAVEPVIACGACFYCLRGQYHLCTDVSFQYRRGQGGITTDFVVAERWVHRLPDQIGYVEGALLEPLAVALHAVNKSGLALGDASVIFGAGAIGLFLLQLIRLAGGGETIVVDVQPHRLETASEFGATHTLDNRQPGVVEQVKVLTTGLGAQRGFEAVGLNLTLVQMLQALRKGGTGVLVGLFESEEVHLPANIFVQNEISLTGSQGYCWDFQTAIELAGQGRLDLGKMISHVFPLAETQAAFEALQDPAEKAVKVAIQIAD